MYTSLLVILDILVTIQKKKIRFSRAGAGAGAGAASKQAGSESLENRLELVFNVAT